VCGQRDPRKYDANRPHCPPIADYWTDLALGTAHYGREDDPVLVWQADTCTANPTVPQRVVDQDYAQDPARAVAEYGAQFRSDLEVFLTREAVEACIASGRRELPPVPRVSYRAFVDPSGGS
jgi:hypothetical protein